MHHHLFPSEDTYITNQPGYEDKNFGINEILRIGTDNKDVRSLESTKDYSYVAVTWVSYCVDSFTGTLSGSFTGSAATANGVIASSASFSSSYFSGSIDGALIVEISGSVSGSISGSVTGSLYAYNNLSFVGELTASQGRLTGLVTGIDTRAENHWITTNTKFVDRTIIKFDLAAISASIAAGEISSPVFKLNLKVCNEYELPISYGIYAFPVSQSWVMGNGYYADGGSDTGASWYYRDYSEGTAWLAPITTSLRPVVDFLTNSGSATGSFNYGGGTWYYNTSASQTFSYEAADIRMDVTNIVMSWISGTLPNHGFILLSSDEIVESGSGFSLTFYAKDTNSINSPYLDAMWSDWVGVSGSFGTSSVSITSSYSGMDVYAQTGSTFTMAGGISGVFSASVFLTTIAYHATSSNVAFTDTVRDFSGSFSGSFSANSLSYINGIISGSALIASASYFSGSIDGAPITASNNVSISGSFVYGQVTGSSVISASSVAYFEGAVISPIGTMHYVTVDGTVVYATYFDEDHYYVYGILQGVGQTGNVSGLPLVGSFTGLLSTTTSSVTGPCGSTFDAQIISGSITGGAFNGTSISGYYVDNKFENIFITGSWPAESIVGTRVDIPIPSGIDPYAYAYVYGVYVKGKALGTYLISGSISGSVGSESASFSGQFIEGPLVGGRLNIQLSGSVTTSSYFYTSSVEITSSGFQPLNTNRPFTVIVKNLSPEFKSGDMVRINVFGRQEFPMKTFAKTSQQLAYIVPELLPSSSYYAIKDNMSEEMIIDFDNYTQISCNYPDGNYFMLDTTGLAQERPYRVLIQVENSGSKYTFDNGNVFKITR